MRTCDLHVSRKARGLGEGVVLDVGPGGSLRVGSGSRVGQDCGDLVVHLAGLGPVSFGRNARIAARICAPRAGVGLGHDNVIVGQVLADTIAADASNDVQCCGGRCACVDDVTPDAASPGGTVSLTTRCDLSAATAVRICGLVAAITGRTTSTLDVVVPAGAAGLHGGSRQSGENLGPRAGAARALTMAAPTGDAGQIAPKS